jgi:hypothetical protein
MYRYLERKLHMGKALGVFAFIVLLSFQLLTTTIFLTPKAYAATNPEDSLKKYLKLEAFKRCIDGASSPKPNPFAPPNGLSTQPTINTSGGLSSIIPKKTATPFGYLDDSPVDYLPGSDYYWYSSEMGVSVGAEVDNDNGQWICGISSHTDEWFKLIGYKDFKDFRDQEYKSYDDELLQLKDGRDKVVAMLKKKISDAEGKVTPITNAQKYIAYYKAFNLCAKRQASANDVIGDPIVFDKFVTLDGKEEEGPLYYERTEADQIPIGHGLGADDGKLACETIADKLKEYADDYIQFATENKDDAAKIGETTNDPPSTVGDSCESKGGDLSWAYCPGIKILGGALNWVDTQLSRLLEVDRDKYNTSEMYDAWSQFRNIGLTLLIAAMLVMVISTALGVGALDAYTVKKAFPRMVVSVIFMLLSWYVCVFLIDVFNVIGRGTLGLMTSPFHGQAQSLTSIFNPTNTDGYIQIGGGLAFTAAAIAIPGALGILMSWIGTGLLILAIAFLVLVARQIFIIVLILFAPLAILSWIFPGNDKLWKFWWQSFSKLLIMYPMIMALIASGRIFAGVIQGLGTDGGEGLLNTLLKLTAYVLPYAFIPFTFKAAGGVFGNLVGMANDRSRGAFDRLKKGRQKGMQDIGKRMGAGVGFRGNSGNVFNRGAGRLAAGPKGWRNKDRAAAIRQGKLVNLGGEQVKDNAIYNAYKNNEKFLLAASNEKLAKKKIADAREKLRTTDPNDTAAVTALTQEIAAREQALAAAQSIPNRNAAFKRQAGVDLAATGYEISNGREGWNELRQMALEASGGDQAAYASMMNDMQFALKGAGRYDTGGINNGASFDYKAGVSKANGYQAGNAKKETHITGAQELLGAEFVQDGKTIGQDEFQAALTQRLQSGTLNAEDFALHHRNLMDAYNGATGGNKDEIGKQLSAIEAVSRDPALGGAQNPVAQIVARNIQDINRGRPLTLGEQDQQRNV